jgi:pyrimidine-nucleoside phosphorylase
MENIHMHAVDIIAKKRDGGSLTAEEITFFVHQFTQGNIPDYQAAAWLMAIYIRGMNRQEIVWLTQAMVSSGEIIDLSDAVEFAVDKHSSGGVGDKTSLVIVPLVAACGVPVAKMSGRGLGHTGGTLDKLESISGYCVELSREEFKRLARENGVVLAGQSANLAPADKALYALRDVTATVACIPLIASSIMSKKIAAGADAIVLDVKVGKGAFMATVEDARALAQTMVNIGVDVGKQMVALISDMNQPLGNAAGLALEVKEAIDTLRNDGPADFREHCLVAASHMLRLAGKGSPSETRALAERTLADGSALAKFRQMVAAQGGDVSQVDDPTKLPTAAFQEAVHAPRRGYVAGLDALAVGNAVLDLGGGRLKKSDAVDHAVGVITHCRVGDAVSEETVLFTLHGNDPGKIAAARQRLSSAVTFSETSVPPLPLFYDTLEGKPV